MDGNFFLHFISHIFTTNFLPVSGYYSVIPPRSEILFAGFEKNGGRSLKEFVFSPIKEVAIHVFSILFLVRLIFLCQIKKVTAKRKELDSDVGIIEMRIFNCINKGQRKQTIIEDSAAKASVSKSVGMRNSTRICTVP